jgi:hypothetical protein
MPYNLNPGNIYYLGALLSIVGGIPGLSSYNHYTGASLYYSYYPYFYYLGGLPL